MNIIGISGKRESGKTTVANHLVENHGFTKVSFAYELRMELVSLGYPHEVLFAKPTHPVIRALMIAHGSARRMIDPDYWVTRLFETISRIAKSGDDNVTRFVVDDMRYRNEADRIKGVGGQLWRVMIDDPLYRLGFIAGVDDHESEMSLDGYAEWDYVVSAKHGDLAELYRQADEIVSPRAQEVE